MITGLGIQKGIPIILAIVCSLVAGIISGIANGLCIAKAHIPPFILTLGLMMTLRDLSLTLNNGQPIFIDIPAYEIIAGGKVLGIPNSVLYFFLINIVFIFLKKVIGKAIYAVGSNEEAS